MVQTAANVVERVLPPDVPLRQLVVTFPFELRGRLGFDSKLLSAVSGVVVAAAGAGLTVGAALAVTALVDAIVAALRALHQSVATLARAIIDGKAEGAWLGATVPQL